MIGFVFVFIIAFALIGLANYYLARRIHGGFSALFPKLPFWPFLAAFILLSLSIPLGFIKTALPSFLGSFFGAVFGYWLGIFIYLLIFTLLSDGVVLILRACRSSLLEKAVYKAVSLAVVLLLTLSVSIYGFINARQIDIVHYDITLEGKTDISDMNIVLLSDLHLGAVGSESRLPAIVNKINAQKPDLVLIAGDFFDTDYRSISNPEAAMAEFKRIESTYGIYACLGNHDAGETLGEMLKFLEGCGIHALNEQSAVIDRRLILVGRLDASPIGEMGGMERGELSSFFSRHDERMPVIVLDHNPKNINEYGREADLILSGHTHEGQIFPANIITELLYSVDHGYYRQSAESPRVIVTSGIGYWGMPMRVGTDSELVTIKISSRN